MNKKILLIDDDEDFVAANKELLEVLGYEVATAHNGTQGIARAQECVPDLIVLDIMMAHDTEGFDVARAIKSDPQFQAVKMLIVSGIVTEKKLPEKLVPDRQWLPVERVLEKPIDPKVFIAEIDKLIGVP